YTFNKRNNRTRDNVTAKGDFILSPRNSFTVSYAQNRDVLDRPDNDSSYSLVPSVANDGTTKLFSLAWRSSPASTLTNEVRFGFNWAPVIFLASQDIPKYYVSGMSYTSPVNTFRTQGRNTDSYNFADNANWVKGPHTVSFGFQGQISRIEVYNDAGIT